MARTLNYKDKQFTGTYHWSEVADWKFITVGNSRVATLFNIPFDDLQSLGIAKVETEECIEIFAQRQEYTAYRGKQPKLNYDNYQIIQLDFDYLLEWQARFFMCLGWDEDQIQKFLSEATLSFVSDRSVYLKKQEIHRYIEQLAEDLGVSRDLVIDRLFQETQPNKAVSQWVQPNPTKGTLIKIGNEYFLDDVPISEKEVGRYKVMKQQLLDWIDPSHQDPVGYMNSLIGEEIWFEPDKDKEPPRSRGAIGWVKTLISSKEKP